MKLLLLLVLTLTSYDAFKIVQEHYWREFNGLLPSDAVPGGAEESGDVTYIGQFPIVAEYHYDVTPIHTLVATLYKGKDHAVAAYSGRSVYSNDTSNLKVLCASSTNKYRWINPKSLFAPNCRFVIGGSEDGVPLYIGKAVLGREKLTGKVFLDSGLIVPYQGGEKKFDTFEVLTYCP